MTTAVLLHGLGRSRLSMRRLETRLREAGYETWCKSYPSRRMGIQDLADLVRDRIESDLGSGPKVAVTHSLGGILARHLSGAVPWKAVVMLAPPNQGSRAGHRVLRLSLTRRFFGPAAREVAAPGPWPHLSCPVGVIAGTLGFSLSSPISWVARRRHPALAKETSDGLVTVSETHLDGAESATVPCGHTWIMNNPQVANLVLRFLATGSFSLEPGSL